MLYKSGIIVTLAILLFACQDMEKNNRNLHFRFENLVELDTCDISYLETIYVPVYTDVYHVDQSRLFPLTVTLSLRNTSLKDTICVQKVDYYNSDGKLVKKHIKDDKMLLLEPLESYELVIDKMTYTGDTGANFIVEWGGKTNNSSMLVQALMINTSGQQGLSFITEGKTINSKTIKP
nr:DUF3124 domain-containing protein [uncultured Carboxylicivirga sp.]